ncbi:hypothetical protein [Entomospira culicis]|uniref:Uncharacterized protein n=1 Tax=Entomospira culicis TaxID=2719989 RepID=A0A968GK62_9SPIO|nr:hypothetical protein [Entomospira culicis]NIZ19998.1 hypothetical protein [Entomospira culicis]NIZ70200.1 hypothetical protein [Entomospira culicis]WDI38095.1 hypothetical protein PVA46_08260 [Entomospira culicis]WDI39717.1 hypothetical protein PVA47_08260 [Entomospira culicis]
MDDKSKLKQKQNINEANTSSTSKMTCHSNTATATKKDGSQERRDNPISDKRSNGVQAIINTIKKSNHS